MLRIFFLLIIVTVLNISSLSQESLVLNPEFYHTWLRYEYYQDIMEGKTPREWKKMSPMLELYFYPGTNLILIGFFFEGMELNYVLKNPDSLIVYEQFRPEKVLYVISLTKVNSESLLSVYDGSENKFFHCLDKKYYRRDGVECFVNDKMIAGEYVSAEDTSLKVSFSTEGKVEGLNDYSKYIIPLSTFELPEDFDTIILRCNISDADCPEVFHWKRSGSSFILYYLKPTSDDVNYAMRYYNNAEIGDKFIELIKVE